MNTALKIGSAALVAGAAVFAAAATLGGASQARATPSLPLTVELRVDTAAAAIPGGGIGRPPQS